MTQKSRQMALAIMASLLTLTSSVALTGPAVDARASLTVVPEPVPVLEASILQRNAEPALPAALERRAKRLQSRLQLHGLPVASIRDLAQALVHRQTLLRARITINFTEDNQPIDTPPWEVSFHTYPQWISYSVKPVDFVPNVEAIHSLLAAQGLPGIDTPVDVTVTNVSDTDTVLRIDTGEAVGRPGWTTDIGSLASTIGMLFESGGGSITVPLVYTEPVVHAGNMDLALLGDGHSDFTTSSWARATNVRKALSNVHNVMVPAGAEFSFTSVLDYPIAPSNGWPLAKTIFGGWELRDAPGGGICQASTTTFRAVLHAGLPIVERKSHSLYVHYYEKYGVGLDATVFPGQQDFTFRNDTGGPLVIQSAVDGFDAHVRIYGKPDGRTVALEGPYFNTNAPSDVLVNNRPVRSNEIVWLRSVRKPDGTEQHDTFVSQYNAVPRSIVAKYTDVAHAAAQ